MQRWFFNIHFGLKLLNASAMQILNIPFTFFFHEEGFCSIKYNNFNLIRSDIIIICWPTIFLQLPASSEGALGHCYSVQFLSSRPSAMHLTTAAEESPVVGLILLWINTTPPFPETLLSLARKNRRKGVSSEFPTWDELQQSKSFRIIIDL